MLDPATALCLGCGRTTVEIGGWISMSPGERRTVMAELPERLQRIPTTTAPAATPRVRQRDRRN